jgi:hypothetical protein
MARLMLAPARLESAAGPSKPSRLFNDSVPVAPALGLSAYAGGYPVRLCEALADTFEAVARFAGEEGFAALAARYTAACPPACYNLNDVGRSLPAFLRADPLARALPFLPDLAELEWKIARAFHAELQPPADTTGLGALRADEWSRVTLALQPGVATVVSRWPLRTLWEARGDARAARRCYAGGHGESVLVYRRDLVVRLDLTNKNEVRALRAIARGRPLAVVLEHAVGRGMAAGDAAAWPARWQHLGLLAGWELADAR